MRWPGIGGAHAPGSLDLYVQHASPGSDKESNWLPAPKSGQLGLTLRLGQLPKVNGFWSITLYDPTYNFTPNPIDRYAIGDRSKGLKRDPEGGLTLYIQNSSPGREKESNWLPSTQRGPFLLVMRTYMPGAEIIEQKLAPRAVMAI